MITFESYKTLRDVDLQTGDRVVIVYRDASDYLKVGTIVSMILSGAYAGDCKVLMDYSQEIKEYYYTNLRKVFELVEYPSGEIIQIYYDDLIELSGLGIVKFNRTLDIYYYQESDRWQIEHFMI